MRRRSQVSAMNIQLETKFRCSSLRMKVDSKKRSEIKLWKNFMKLRELFERERLESYENCMKQLWVSEDSDITVPTQIAYY